MPIPGLSRLFPLYVFLAATTAFAQYDSVVNRARQERERRKNLEQHAPVTTNEGTITTERFVVAQKVEQPGITINLEIDSEVTSTTDCGGKDCFQQKFAACQPALVQFDAGFVAGQYKIVGPAKNGCRVTLRYTTFLDPEWENKELTCAFDNKLPYEKALEKVLSGFSSSALDAAACEGPLYKVIMRQTQPLIGPLSIP